MPAREQLARWFSYHIQVNNQYSQYKGDWAISTSYVIGDIVLNSGTYYYCIQDHTSDSDTEDVNEPGVGSSWEDYWNSLGDDGYAEITGLNSFDPSPEKNDSDTTTFDDEGWISHLVATRGLTVTIEGLHQEDETTGARDPGQAVVEDLAENSGASAMEMFKAGFPSGDQVKFEASVDAPPKGISSGGGQGEAATWTATITMSGQAEEVV